MTHCSNQTDADDDATSEISDIQRVVSNLENEIDGSFSYSLQRYLIYLLFF